VDFLTKGKEVEQQFAKTLSNPKQSTKDQDINKKGHRLVTFLLCF